MMEDTSRLFKGKLRLSRRETKSTVYVRYLEFEVFMIYSRHNINFVQFMLYVQCCP